METVVSGPIVHRCPIVDEIDVGTVELRFPGDAPELHGLAGYLDSWATVAVTHEDLTRGIAGQYPWATITTRFRTAGLDVECVVGPIIES